MKTKNISQRTGALSGMEINSHLRRKNISRRKGFAIVMVTAPDIKTARKLAKAALKMRLVACVNLIPGLESHYWWEGKMAVSSEILMLLKTRTARLSQLENFIQSTHPYETPEFLTLPPGGGSKKYLDWLAENCR